MYNQLNLKYCIEPERLKKVILPQYIEIIDIDPRIQKRGSASTATIKLRVEEDNEAIVRGQTGKIVPKEFLEGKTKWVEIGQDI